MDKSKGFIFFCIIWIGDFISTIGSGLTAFSLGVYAFKMTGEATATAMIVLVSFTPAFVLRPIGGVLADRFNRPILMIIGNLGSAVGIGFVLILMSLNPNNLLIIYPGIALSSIFFALQNPAYKASVTDFIPPEQYSKASGLIQLSNSAQFLISPLLAGILMSLMDIRYVLFIDIITFVFSAIVVLWVKFIVKTPKKSAPILNRSIEQSHIIGEIIEGIKPIINNRGILVLVSLVSLLLFYVGLFQTLLTPLVLSFTNARSLGLAQSICGLGMLISSLVISIVERKRKNVFILGTSLSIMGIFFSLTGIFANIWAIIIPGFLFFITIPFINSSIDVLIRKNISNEKQGRVWSMISVITYIGAIIAYAVSGFLADKIFNPLFMPNSLLVDSLGRIFGVGPGRGIAFMFFISGIFIVLISILIFKSKTIHQLENSNNETFAL